MRERSEQILRIVCMALGALLLFQLVNVALRSNPLRGLTIPPLPSLTATAESPTGGKGTNAVSSPVTGKNATNAALAESDKKGTNNPAAQAHAGAITNSMAGASAAEGTNLVSPHRVAKTGTNSVMAQADTKAPSNSLLKAEMATAGSEKAGTNSGVLATGKGKAPSTAEMARKGMNPIGRPGAGKPAPELPPAILARVVKVTESEILGQVMHPMPMALLGIAGDVAFLRSPSGQTGLVKEGDKLGELKLIRIGTNRVLVDLEGKTNELMIFSGLGGESLLPK